MRHFNVFFIRYFITSCINIFIQFFIKERCYKSARVCSCYVINLP